MKTIKKELTLKQMKSQIAKATKDFEKRMFNAKNDLELFQVYEDCRKIIHDEISNWLSMYIEKKQEPNNCKTDELDAIAHEISELIRVDLMIEEEQEGIFNMAKELYRANQNMGNIPRDAKPLEMTNYEKYSIPKYQDNQEEQN